MQREARSFMASSMVPDTFRDYVLDKSTGEWKENPQALSNCVIALNMALRMHADPLMVMQNLYIVHGVPAWSAKFLIGLFNTCGRFSAIRYAFNEKRDACFAWCRELSTGERIEGPSASLAMAKAEGWTSRKGSKWLTMPEVMLTNRAAAFLIRTTAPELSLGLPMRDEAEDVFDVEAREVDAAPSRLQTVRDLLREQPAPDRAPSPAADAPDASAAVESPHAATPPDATLTDAQRAAIVLEPGVDTLPPDVDLPRGVTPFGLPINPPPPVTAPTSEGETVTAFEPKSLPVKDGELTPQDAARRTGSKPKPKPAFDADAYSRRIAAVKDLDLLTLMRDEIASLPPSTERENLVAELDSRTRELIGNSIDGENAS
ncbi:MAG TPA: hypothetical protein VK955_06430 [Xanthobacteraceae bacterium]|nr:hypothetical protein [Xanthobacteraceae bacterium]